jgi:hypothetical protein
MTKQEKVWREQAKEYFKIYPQAARVSFASYKDGHILFTVTRKRI